jgi:CRP-like cAMP-binding protein
MLCVQSSSLLPAQLSPTSIFSPASTPADSIFGLSLFVLSVTGAIFLVVFSMLVYAAVKYRSAVLGTKEFFGEHCLTGERLRAMTVTAMQDCSLVLVEKRKMQRILAEDVELAMAFISYLLARNLRLHEELVDRFFNHSEERLVRLVLSLARSQAEDRNAEILPKLSQQTLAEMVGTTRGRVSHFMSNFRKQSFIDYMERRPPR